MNITWFGESGFLLEDDRYSILIDPYFTDSLGEKYPEKCRLLPVNPEWLKRSYDLALFSHCHIDHADPATIRKLNQTSPRLLLAGPPSVRKTLGKQPFFFELFPKGCVDFGDFHIRALPAVHSDCYALGYEIVHKGRKLYFSGDTALLCDLAKRVSQKPDIAFLCFNAGVGKNMNEEDAVKLASLLGAQCVIPFHYGLLPGGTTPEHFCRLLSEKGINWYLPAYGECFSIDSVSVKKKDANSPK